MLPKIAMPRAPPSSDPVSEIPEAAPACSRGADPTISSVVAVNTGANPSETITEAVITSVRSSVPSTPVSIARPTAPIARPAPITYAGRTRRRIQGATWDPTMKPTADGNDHRPASSGDSPSTSWRYCATNRKYPNAMKMPRTFVANDALKARTRNSDRSIIGSSSVS